MMFGKNGRNGHVGFNTLSEIHKLFAIAQRRLEKDIGCSICIPNCGKCCEVNCISIKGVESAYISEWLRKQKPEFRENVLDRCGKWLLDFEVGEKTIGVRKGLGTSGMNPEVLDQVMAEIGLIGNKSPCPLFDEETKKCLIHPVRPLQCRAFGVTRIVSTDVCPRPYGKGESEETRKYIQDDTVFKIKEKIGQLKVEMSDVYISTSMYIATILYAEFRSQKFIEHVYHGDFPSAKLAQLSSQTLLWQPQLVEMFDRETEIRMLVNPTVI